MAHFVELDESNVVIRGIVVGNQNCLDEHGSESEAVGIVFCQSLYGAATTWKQTSYNTHGGVHQAGGNPFRKNYAGVGYFYDTSRDAFIPPSPYPSWVLNEESCLWESPVPRPPDTETTIYSWNEADGIWEAHTIPTQP